MKRYFTVIILITLIYACKPGIPENLIQPKEMEKVLFDIHIVDGYVSALNLPNQDTSKTVAAPLYRGVYKKYSIDSALYAQSLDYYYQHPDILKKIYDSVAVKLNVLKDQTIKVLSVSDESNYLNIFEKAKDSSRYDPSLNRKYNYRYLMKDRFGNIYNDPTYSAPMGSTTPVNAVPEVQAQPVLIPKRKLTDTIADKAVQ